MALLEHEINIATGRRSEDGHVRLYVFADGLLAISVEGTSERVPTLLLTTEQAQKLLQALSDLIPQASGGEAEVRACGEWNGAERRGGAR